MPNTACTGRSNPYEAAAAPRPVMTISRILRRKALLPAVRMMILAIVAMSLETDRYGQLVPASISVVMTKVYVTS